MEALTAFSLAGNILEFSRFGMSLLSDALELYKSSQGALSANDQLELATADLGALIVKLRARHGPPATVDAPTMDKESEDAFQHILRDAEKTAAELVHRLEGLKVRGHKSKKWESIRKAIQSAWTKDEIASLTKKLAGFKDTVKTHILFSIVSVTLIASATLRVSANMLCDQ
jgi:hypothetical protein